MTRAQLEALITDYLDGVLGETDAAEFEKYLPLYPDLAELVHDAADAMRLLDQVEAPEPPPALYAQIHLSLEAERKNAERKRSSTGLWKGLLEFFAPMLQPRFVMGMAMTVLSISMVGQLTGTRIDQVTAADLKPAAIWSSVEYRAQRVWDRATKYYESLRVVYEMRTRVQEWRTQLDQERERAASRLEDPETEVGRSPRNADGTTTPGAAGGEEKIKDK
jgi:anti-sigma factor RsiW